MEKAFGQEAYSTHFDNFMRHYLTVKTGDFPRLPVSPANQPIGAAHNHHGREAEAAAAFYGGGAAPDVDEALFELYTRWIYVL